MGLAHEKKSYLQEKANLFEIGSPEFKFENGRAARNCSKGGILMFGRSLAKP